MLSKTVEKFLYDLCWEKANPDDWVQGSNYSHIYDSSTHIFTFMVDGSLDDFYYVRGEYSMESRGLLDYFVLSSYEDGAFQASSYVAFIVVTDKYCTEVLSACLVGEGVPPVPVTESQVDVVLGYYFRDRVDDSGSVYMELFG